MISLSGVNPVVPGSDDAVLDGCFVYASRGKNLVPLVKARTNTLIRGAWCDMHIIVAKTDDLGRFKRYINHTTAKRLLKNSALLEKSTGITYVSWQVDIDGVGVILQFALDKEGVRVLEACVSASEIKGFNLSAINVMPDFLRDTGITPKQPYAAFASSTYPDTEDARTLSKEWISETLSFFLFCLRIARKILSITDETLIKSRIDIVTFSISIAAMTQIKYRPDLSVDLPTLPISGMSRQRANEMIGDCEDMSGYTVGFVCRLHQALQSVRMNAGAESEDRCKWIMSLTHCADGLEAVFLYEALAIVWNFVPLHMVIESDNEFHSTPALSTVTMTTLLFGDYAVLAAPAHMRTDSNGVVGLGLRSYLDTEISKIAPFIMIDSTVFQSPTRLSTRFDSPCADTSNEMVFDAASNLDYLKSAKVVALFGAECARAIDGGVLLSTLSAYDIPRDIESIAPLFAKSDNISGIFDQYERLEPTYPPAPLFVSLEDGLTGPVDPACVLQLFDNEPKDIGSGSDVYKFGCRFLRVDPFAKTFKKSKKDASLRMSGAYH